VSPLHRGAGRGFPAERADRLEVGPIVSERLEGLVHRPVERPELIDERPRRRLAEVVRPNLAVDDAGPRPEQFLEAAFGAPLQRRPDSRRRRNVRSDHFEHPADERIRSPNRQRDLASRLGHPEHLGRAGLLIGREHHPDDGGAPVELPVREGECLGIAFDQPDGQTFGLRSSRARPSSDGKRSRAQPYGTPPAPRPASRCRCRIEHAITGAQVSRVQEVLRHDRDARPNRGIVARRPRRLLSGCHRLVVDLPVRLSAHAPPSLAMTGT
jgi:hypothetical protein